MEISDIITIVSSIIAAGFACGTYYKGLRHDKKQDTLDAYNQLQEQALDKLYLIDIAEMKEIAKNSTQNKIFNNISNAEYYFVTEKGDYDRYIIDFTDDSESQLKEELCKLITEIRTGNFSKDENSKCMYCEYADACKYKGGDN